MAGQSQVAWLLSQQTQADNGVYQFAYTIDPSNNVIQTNVTDPLNIVRQVTFDSFGKMAT